MASNRSDSSESDGSSYDPPFVPAYIPPYEPEPAHQDFTAQAAGEWAPGEDHPAAPVRGRHRVVKPRGGTMARSGAVLGAGMIAAVGAGGMASAQDRPQAPISMPDLTQSIPVVGSLMADGHEQGARRAAEAQQAPVETVRTVRDTADAGEVLRARILQQAENQQNAAEAEAQARVAQAAAEQHRKAAAEKAAAEREAAEREAADAKAATYEAAQREAREAREAAGGGAATDGSAGTPERHASGSSGGSSGAAERSAHRAAGGTFTLPVASYTLTAGFGQAGNMWSANHTGEDFAAPTGTPVKAVGGGTVTQAGWAGAYGYRVVLTLDDGTEVWYCHLSSMVVTSGKVGTGTVIGRVGATGNVTGPHLHLEVRPGGGAPVDPLSWLRGRGLEP
ncbi:M23 family metallopeptidase [Streptomyces luteoverticillatus]|uniref:M23 family metallopeptidase n=1 Tax=Streptomyces luteoverticillatus TaxID=66425 RepID=UPI001F0C6DCE|nr:M23 family metallopeptidase [Streptomyces luteoverticillatus]